MAKRNVEIEDTLQERCDSAIQDVKEEMISYLDPRMKEYLGASYGPPDLHNDLDYSGAIHEIVDGSVPIYTKEIDDTWYLYGSDCEKAFDDAGFEKDGKWPMGWQAAAIYCYIEQEVASWYHDNAQEIFDEWKEKHDAQETPESE